jgi:hypothetical protein
MFFLFGFKNKAKAIAQRERACAKCSRPTMHAIVESKRWFTLFFIPVIPCGTSFTARCGVCGLSSKCEANAAQAPSAVKTMAAKA